MAGRDNFAGVFSAVATKASEQGHANFIGKIVSEPNRKALADKLNRRLDQFRGDVAQLIIGTTTGMTLTANTRQQEHAKDFTGSDTTNYKVLSKSWLKRKKDLGASANFFVFGKTLKRTGANAEKNTPRVFLGDYLAGELASPSRVFGKVKASDVKIYSKGQRVVLIGGRLKESDAKIKAAGGTSGNKIRNFSPHDRQFEVRVSMLNKVSYLKGGGIRLQYFVAKLLDPENNAASGFARSKLGRQAVGRPNVGHLLLWYYQVKLPAVMRSHYSHTKVLEF